jgi:hypoxanthine phosphoribosyltransferase
MDNGAIKYTFEMYQEDLRHIIKKHVVDIPNLHLYGIYRGGLIPAVHLSNVFSKKLNILKFQRLDDNDKVPKVMHGKKTFSANDVILVIDDICDSGITMETVRKFFLDRGVKESNLHLVCLLGSKNDHGVKYARKIPRKGWVHFFWEDM